MQFWKFFRLDSSIAELPVVPDILTIAIIKPPATTRQFVTDAIALSIEHIWIQADAEDDQASQSARSAGVKVIDDGSCILVLLKIVK